MADRPLALTYAGGFRAGQSVLVSAVAGAVGNAAAQLARAQGAGRVITAARSTAKAEHSRSLGYGDMLDLSREPLGEGSDGLQAAKGWTSR